MAKLDQFAVRKIAEDYCAGLGQRQNREVWIGKEVVCVDPPGTYFTFNHSPDQQFTGGPCGILVYHDTGRFKTFETGWYYGKAETMCKSVFNESDPEFVFRLLLHPNASAYMRQLAAQRGIKLPWD